MPGPQAREKFHRPLVDRFEDDLPAHPPDDHLVLIIAEATRLREAHSLTAPVLENLGSLAHAMTGSIYASIYGSTQSRLVSAAPSSPGAPDPIYHLAMNQLHRLPPTVIVGGLLILNLTGCGASGSKCLATCVDLPTDGPDAGRDAEAADTASDGDGDGDGESPDKNGNADVGGMRDAACGADGGFLCAAGVGSPACGEMTSPAICLEGGWQCPAFTMPISQCKCFGQLAPGCRCTDSGPVCTDGGLDGGG